MPIAASGWMASNVQVIHSAPNAQVVQLQLNAADFGSGTDVAAMPSAPEYFPLPQAAMVGLQRIDYVIPLCAFHHVTRAGRWIRWGYNPGAPSGGSPVAGAMRFFLRDNGNSPAPGPSYTFEAVSGTTVTTLLTTDTMRAYALFVGG